MTSPCGSHHHTRLRDARSDDMMGRIWFAQGQMTQGEHRSLFFVGCHAEHQQKKNEMRDIFRRLLDSMTGECHTGYSDSYDIGMVVLP